MKKNTFIFGIGVVLLIIVNLTGCDEKGVEVEEENLIFFDSDIVELVESSLDFTKSGGKIVQADVSVRFRNLLDKTINWTYAVKFCDKDDNVHYQDSLIFGNMPPRYIEQSPNIFSYTGDKANYIDHVNVHILDYEIIG